VLRPGFNEKVSTSELVEYLIEQVNGWLDPVSEAITMDDSPQTDGHEPM